MPDSLVNYGHGDIELVFTDSTRADKAELEHIFPALLRNVHPVPNHSSLAPLEIPQDWSTWVLSSEYQIRACITCILDDLAKLDAGELKVGFDMEWPVDRINGIQGQVAIIQISYGKDIFILQLCTFLRNGVLHLPRALLTFLRSSRIQKDLNSDEPFSGALELGGLAKTKDVANRASVGLADLVARTLHRHLDKDDSIHISNQWSDPILTKQQEQYAALDVYACWSVFEVLDSSPEPGAPVSMETPEGTPINLLAWDCTQVIARGVMLSDRPKVCRGVPVSKARVLVKVTQIEVPGYCLPANLSPEKEPILLGALRGADSLPLTMYYKFSHLRTSTPPHPQHGTISTPPSVLSTCAIGASSDNPVVTRTNAPHTPELDESHRDELLGTAIADDDVGRSWHEDIEYDPAVEQAPEASSSDAASAQQAEQLHSVVNPPNSSDTPSVIRSRVLRDIWHLMDQFKISVNHGLRRPFARALRDAIFIPDPEDKAAVEDELQRCGTSFKAMFLSHPEWILRRMKRHVPEPETLVSRISEVLFTYGPLKDAKTGQPLFNDAAWDTVRNVLENICRGYYSDLPGLSLYFVRGHDKDSLLLYRSLHGTNHVEGGVHQNIIQCFSAYNASPEFAVNLLRDYSLCHNLWVGTYNWTGAPYQGSYDIWQCNRIAQLMDLTEDSIDHPEELRSSWVNIWDYKESEESFGILLISPTTRASLGMLDYHPDFGRDQKIRHR
ncbi:hypothetical protein EWM64_g291 [Hericium alpestre]|uniref:3'-5' exonuclease n=1 Tax=Hericium alpestre TaxID=135208 RepID=A0A4Z0AD06_9AGAM|nr:hypothetical protein EWM64_g291 [Hericium alpestre]